MSATAFSLLHQGVQRAIYRLGWKELHYVQGQSIAAILNGTGHLLICAPTAGGKTEAAFLPIISRIAESPRPSVQALYVGPLIALINDQFARLEELCIDVDVPVHRWHGMATASEKRKFRETPGGILLITPESLESNFINYGPHVPRIYADLEFVVIDELHSFLSNVRGIHLRSLLSRLVAETGRRPRVVALSATLGDPEGVRSFIAPDAPGTVTIIQDPALKRSVQFGIKAYLCGQPLKGERVCRWRPSDALESAQTLDEHHVGDARPLEAVEKQFTTFALCEGDELDEIADDILRTCADRTNLVFANAKRGLEVLADRLHERVKVARWTYDPFHVHHGSLSKDLREETETILKSGVHATVLCSSTLELGIDIGSVRRVAQIDPPWSVSSMLQRLGRSGRRTGEIATLRIYARDDSPHPGSSTTDLLFPNLVRCVALARLLFEKWLEPHDTGRLSLSTLVHQILSCLRQTGGLPARKLRKILVEDGPFRAVPHQMFDQVLQSLAGHRLVEQMPEGEIILAPDGERVTGNRDFYAAFAASEEFTVRHDGDEIGRLQNGLVPPVGETLILGGRRWQVDYVISTAKTVFVSPAKGGKAAQFRGAAGEIHNRVVGEMRAALLEAEEPAYLDGAARTLLCAGREFARRVGAIEPGFIVRADSIQWFPWIGSRGLLTLDLHARCDGLACATDVLSITYRRTDLNRWVSHLGTITRNDRTSLELAKRMEIKSFEKFDDVLPEDLLDHANAHGRLDMDAASTSAARTLETIKSLR